MGGPHDLFPGVGRKLPLREEPSDVVVEDLRGRPGDRSESVFPAGRQELTERDTHLRGAVEDLHRAERVDVDPRDTRFHRIEQIQIEGPGQVGMDPSLHAHLARPVGPRLLRPVGHLSERERVRLRVDLPLRERAEPAPHVADVGEVDVPVDHVGDHVADGLLPEAVGDRRGGHPGPRPRPGTRRGPRHRRSGDGAPPCGAPGGSPRRDAPAPPSARPTPP